MNPSPNALPRLLLVEDDPVSAVFLRDAAAALPAEVDVAGSIADALVLAGSRRYDLYLIDANLPDGRGETLLQALRERGLTAAALAHTATRDATIRERLLAAGFVGMICKPLSVAELHEALHRYLGIAPPICGKPPNWDDAAALSALGGQQEHVDALRGLFLKELPGQRQLIQMAAACGDEAAIRDELHRLVASCGFVGAARLGATVHELQAVPLDAQALQRLGFAMDDLLGEMGSE